MIRSIFLLVMVGMLAGCGNGTAPSASAEQAKIAPEPPRIDHYYSMQDGLEYGYEAAISQDAANAGQVATKLMMFRYAGSQGAKHQVYSKDGATVLAIECSNPCDFIKMMTFFQGEHVSTDRIRATEGNLATMVIMDAVNGKLERFFTEKDGKKVAFWFDEKSGPQRIPVDEKKN